VLILTPVAVECDSTKVLKGGTAPASETWTLQRPTAGMHMGSVPERYCARGEQCKLYDIESGRSQKLRRQQEGEICDPCSRALVDEDLDAHQRNPSVIYEPVSHEENPRKARLVVMKRNLVAQLLLRQGGFWEAIKNVRSRWQLDPVPTQLPPNPRTYSTRPGRRRQRSNRSASRRSFCPWTVR
jgi:hypothetical protein